MHVQFDSWSWHPVVQFLNPPNQQHPPKLSFQLAKAHHPPQRHLAVGSASFVQCSSSVSCSRRHDTTPPALVKGNQMQPHRNARCWPCTSCPFVHSSSSPFSLCCQLNNLPNANRSGVKVCMRYHQARVPRHRLQQRAHVCRVAADATAAGRSMGRNIASQTCSGDCNCPAVHKWNRR